MIDMTRKGAKSSEAQEISFIALKTAVAQPLILRLPDVKTRIIVQTASSTLGLGAVLKHPVAFASRKFLPREVNYSTIGKVCLVII